MATKWRYASVDSISEKVAMGPFGSSIKVETFVPEGIPVISGQHLHGTRLEDKDYNFISLEHANRLANANVRRGDVVFTHAGSIGQAAYIPEHSRYERYVISQRQFYLRPNREVVLPEFIAYYFASPEGHHKLLANTSSSGVPSIARPVSYLRTIEVPVPPVSEQRAIARILGALDDKIELNRRMNETLEAMARALFKSWFIDFDPVRAKAEGRDPGLPTSIASFFPASFEDSDMGEIPKGWKVEPFSDTVDIVGGGTPKTTVPEYWDGDIPWFSVVDAPSVTDAWVIDTEKKITHEGVEKSSTRILPVGTTIISARGTVGRLALVGVPMAMNQSCYGLQGKAEHSSSFTYYSTRRLVTVLQQHAHGSVFDTITRDTLAGVSIPVPPANVVQAFDSRVSPIFGRLRAALFESGTLAALRDALLPKLMSGELRVATDQRL